MEKSTCQKSHQAITALLREDSAECIANTIEELWEAWLCSNAADGTTSDQRYTKLSHVKALKNCLQTI